MADNIYRRGVKMKHKTAFTLIELLVVVAIISVLIALLLPSLSSARDMAKKTTCMSNQRQFQIGFRFYGSDYNNALPTVKDSFHKAKANSLSLLYPKYLSAPGVYRCPGEAEGGTLTKKMTDGSTFTTSYIYQDSAVASSYGWNTLRIDREYTDRVFYNKYGIPIMVCNTGTTSGPITYINHGGGDVVFGRAALNMLFLEQGDIVLKTLTNLDDNPRDGMLYTDDSVYYLYGVTANWRGINFNNLAAWN
jgi:prepilin-type N-terminal cleavage/methylation domain-containing protein